MSKSKIILFYVLSFTWGTIMSLIGCVAALFLLITGHKPQKFHDRIYFQIGEYWGGVNLGCFFITDKYTNLHTKQHESGHGFQNCLFGPLMPFIVCLPSVIRYWLLEFKTQKGKYIYSIIISLIILLIGLSCFIPGSIFNILWLVILGGLIIWYFIWIFCWLIFIEIPQYKEKPYPNYDNIWFEKQATEIGSKIYPED